jgi:hypothetical protein
VLTFGSFIENKLPNKPPKVIPEGEEDNSGSDSADGCEII